MIEKRNVWIKGPVSDTTDGFYLRLCMRIMGSIYGVRHGWKDSRSHGLWATSWLDQVWTPVATEIAGSAAFEPRGADCPPPGFLQAWPEYCSWRPS